MNAIERLIQIAPTTIGGDEQHFMNMAQHFGWISDNCVNANEVHPEDARRAVQGILGNHPIAREILGQETKN